ncbi:MAG: leucyl aminopeptidase [Chromatiaceae bacterium]|nr:MAG: leucyl aminopeptidase [Chromatiaceae bacterium]
MQLGIQRGDLAAIQTPCLLLGLFTGRDLSPAAAAVDQASGGAIARLIGRGDLDGPTGTCLLAYDLPGVAAERVLLLSCGVRAEFNRAALVKALTAALTRLGEARIEHALAALPALPTGLDQYQTARQALLLAAQSAYRYTQTKEPAKEVPPPLAGFQLWAEDDAAAAVLTRAAEHAQAIAAGLNLARNLGNLPGNLCTPTYLAEQALALGERYAHLTVEVLDEAAMAELGMGALLSVSRGSREPAKLIVLQHRGGEAAEKPLVLVGKGLTFDAGGISIKPAADMDEMKYDMAGGAAVLGAMHALGALDLPLNVIGVVPASENLPDGAANKPGDIVRSMSGQTIEILNTDAEGRLILCDALTYCERFEPALVVDMATLTGACVVALGRHASGLFTADDELATELLAAGEAAGDRLWRMPLWDDYRQQLDSNFADLANVGGREAGAVTAAVFLSRFAKAYRWAHLDIAGTAWLSGKEKGGTGRPVPMLVEFLLRQAGQAG